MGGRRPFKGVAPAGFRVRMMEPGEAGRLRAIDGLAAEQLRRAGYPALPGPPPPADFARWLVRHEVFVAERKGDGEAVGFAAAAELESPAADAPGDVASCYWLAALGVDPAFARQGVGSALLGAVLRRAGWFFHRAVALSTFRDVPFNAPFYRKRGFLTVPRQDWPASFEAAFRAELPPGVAEEDRVVMVRWL